jgi:hypothetical protein
MYFAILIDFSEAKMKELVEFSKALTEMPLAALVTLIVLGSFALSAFAIYSIAKIAKGRRNGN